MRRAAIRLLLLAIALALLTGPPVVRSGADEEIVAFNVETKKYHCLRCQWAIRCTRNCIEIGVSQAKRRGGIPCKVCGGTCR